ncbi:MAG: winged helix-turn-helix domain-containing protein, partial [Myxococcales bacterium]|nr:winged helix-turn-helix domain-containing protein [Myxococcales bacterium]
VLGQRVDLTTGEFELLWLLAQHVGEPVSRDLYYREIRGIRYDGLDRMMDARMSDLRRKLAAAGLPEDRICTVRGVGYQLTAAA